MRAFGQTAVATVLLNLVCLSATLAQLSPVNERVPTRLQGLEFVLTNSGFGIGGFFQDSLSTRFNFIGEIRIAAGKDEREVAFFDRFGRRTIPGKANYLLIVPLSFGTQYRIFSERIENSFRPFIQFSGGPTFGWEYPYFEDCNGNGVFELEADCNGNGTIDGPDEGERRLSSFDALPEGQLRTGVGASLGLGAHFGYGTKGVLGLKIDYTIAYFFNGIQLLEAPIKPRQSFFRTPTIAIFFSPGF
ncbi:MAG: hypothetical protein HKN43_11225 [Rhodothermales bacterium]|nr:hypothetical protein [Rhodothermales bacterium]